MPAHDRSHAASEAMADTVADDDDLNGGVLVFERLRHAAPESMGLADRVLWVIAKVSTAPPANPKAPGKTDADAKSQKKRHCVSQLAMSGWGQ